MLPFILGMLSSQRHSNDDILRLAIQSMQHSTFELMSQSANSIHADLIDSVENQRRLGIALLATGIFGGVYCLALIFVPHWENVALAMASLCVALIAAICLPVFALQLLMTAQTWARRASWLYRNTQALDLKVQSSGDGLQFYEPIAAPDSIPFVEISVRRFPNSVVAKNLSGLGVHPGEILSVRCDFFCGGAAVIETNRGLVWGLVKSSKFVPIVKNLFGVNVIEEIAALPNRLLQVRFLFAIQSLAVIATAPAISSTFIFNIWFQLLCLVLIVLNVGACYTDRLIEVGARKRILRGKERKYAIEGDIIVLATLALQRNLQERADLCNKILVELNGLSSIEKTNIARHALTNKTEFQSIGRDRH